MEELETVLDKIEKIYCTMPDSKEKHQRLEKLWTSYYKILKEQNLQSDRGYQLYLLGENESFITEARNKISIIDEEKLRVVLEKLENNQTVLKKEEFQILLDWSVSNARKIIESFGISVENNSLNGFCEFGQALTILPFEKKNFKITKNTAKTSFGYLWNHAFGTVSCNIQENGRVEMKTYLVDATYLQFFSTVRCNEGRYDTIEENSSLPTAPDPGYFLTTSKEKQFAQELIEKGYIELTDENAKIYANGFRKASLLKDEREKGLPEINEKFQILKTSTPYSLNPIELEEMGAYSIFPTVQLLTTKK